MRTLPFDKFKMCMGELKKSDEYIKECLAATNIHLTDHFPCRTAACDLLEHVFGRNDLYGQVGGIIETWLFLSTYGRKDKIMLDAFELSKTDLEKIPETVEGLYDLLVEEQEETCPMPLGVFVNYMDKVETEVTAREKFRKVGFDVFGLNAIDTVILLLEFIIGDESEGITWWVYEKDFGKKKIEAFDADDNIVPTDTAEDLYFYLERIEEGE